MGIFSILGKRKTREDLKPDVILTQVLEYTPEVYKTSKYYAAASDFLASAATEQALDNIVGLAEESGHYFSEDFWLNLAVCANKMKLSEKTDFCYRQIARNKEEIGLYAPKGWTIIKVADNIHTFQIAKVIKEDWKGVQHKRDNLQEFIKENGFHLKPFGWGGTIYYIENGRVLEIDFELSSGKKYDMLLAFETIKHWTKPFEHPFTKKEKDAVRAKLVAWLKKKQLRTDLEL